MTLTEFAEGCGHFPQGSLYACGSPAEESEGRRMKSPSRKRIARDTGFTPTSTKPRAAQATRITGIGVQASGHRRETSAPKRRQS